jgi:hypothetical protein
MMMNVCVMKSPWEAHRSLSSMLNLIIIALLIAVALQKHNDRERQGDNIMDLRAFFFVGCIFLIIMAFHRKKKRNVYCIHILPFGVQIEETSIDSDGGVKVLKKKFIPKECIIDIVVTEVISSYRLMSIVVFRIHDHVKEIRDADRKLKDASLVTAFNPDKMEVGYCDCIMIAETLKKAIFSS